MRSKTFLSSLLAPCLFLLLASCGTTTMTTAFAFTPSLASTVRSRGSFSLVKRTHALPSSSPSVASRSSLSMAMEQTYIMIKPDGVQRGLIGTIISRFESRGFKLVAMKTRLASAELLDQHYKDLVSKPFFPKLRDYMLSGPVICMVWEGTDAVGTGRKMLGATNPLESAPGTIRGDFCLEVGRNICHGSDSVENAQREIALWFDQDELLDWTSHSVDWIYE